MGADFKRFKERKNRHNMSGSENSRKRERLYFSNYSVGSEFTIVYANLKSNIYYKDLEGMNNKKSRHVKRQLSDVNMDQLC